MAYFLQNYLCRQGGIICAGPGGRESLSAAIMQQAAADGEQAALTALYTQNPTGPEDTGVGSDGQYLYRGVHAGHPALTEAEAGNAEPRGGHSDPALHNGGNNESIFTSWTTDPGIAYDVANEYGPGGVVLRIPESSVEGRTVASPDIYGESEVLIKEAVAGADVTDVSEFGRIWGFLGNR